MKMIMNVCQHQMTMLLIVCTLILSAAFVSQSKIRTRTSDTRIFLAPSHQEWDRRSVVESIVAGAGAALTLGTSPQPASAMMPYLDCLLDLPALDPDCVRIYLCRHAETENNRLRMVQGARIDPPINYNGIQQSLLGSALARLNDSCPSVIFHSPLTRAKETAQYAARNIVDKEVQLSTMTTLAEVDFGPIADGQPMSVARGGMIATYGAWAAGYIDTRPEGGGESGREVLTRCAAALQALVEEAEINGGSIAAVAHSKFLKVLLAAVQDMPLTIAVTSQQMNGCINVLDMKRNSTLVTTLGPKCNLLGGLLSNAPNDFDLQVPIGKVRRINEKRHLEDLDFERLSV